VSNLPEIKERLDNLTKLSIVLKDQFTGLQNPEGEALKKKAKAQGTRFGIGAGISFFGAMIAALALLYSLAVIILLVNIALDRPWLSALIVVGGFLVIGGVLLGIGAGIAKSSAKELSKTAEDVKKQLKDISNQVKSEVDELQKLLKQETDERQKQMAEMVTSAKKAAPAAAPLAAGAYLGFRLIKRRFKSRKERRAILEVVQLYDAVRNQ
jgi:uncharacterized membrane-anchored protein YhcB (DUF1043 family)